MKALKKRYCLSTWLRENRLLSEWMLREWQEMAGIRNMHYYISLLQTTLREPTAKKKSSSGHHNALQQCAVETPEQQDHKQLAAKTQRAPFRPLCRRDRRLQPESGPYLIRGFEWRDSYFIRCLLCCCIQRWANDSTLRDRYRLWWCSWSRLWKNPTYKQQKYHQLKLSLFTLMFKAKFSLHIIQLIPTSESITW